MGTAVEKVERVVIALWPDNQWCYYEEVEVVGYDKSDDISYNFLDSREFDLFIESNELGAFEYIGNE